MRHDSMLPAIVACACLMAPVAFADPVGEAPQLGEERITQQQIESGGLSLQEIRLAGLRMFTTLFNKLDGYGDGPMAVADPVTPGGRPTLQGNGTFLRVNGLDAQGCIECHATVSAATVPPRLGIGGVGGSNTNAIIMPTLIGMGDPTLDGEVEFNGRFANPPFLFGAGAVELLAQEMTGDLQQLKALALSDPGTVYELETKGVRFGTIVANDAGELDTAGVVGVNDDLVVRPFGRKGEFFSIRNFDIEAMMFHFGMQPVESVGAGVDDDGDGVTDEVLVGELSALGVFISTIERPFMEPLDEQASAGFELFEEIGCASCHIPALETESMLLGFRNPELPAEPLENVFLAVDLSSEPTSFELNDAGGITVPLFADLKRHDMGPGLAESFALASDQFNREFTTARLWGVADTAPYLHDGRATTLTEAILAHGGEAEEERDRFDLLPEEGKLELLSFLRSLRTPEAPVEALLEAGEDEDGDDDGDDDEVGDGPREIAVETDRPASPGNRRGTIITFDE